MQGPNSKPPIQQIEGKPRLMSATIAADWGNDVVVIQEKSKDSNLNLLNPITFVIPMDEFMLIAYNLGTQRIERAVAARKNGIINLKGTQ